MSSWSRRDDGRWLVPPEVEPFVDLLCYAICGIALAYMVLHLFRAGWISF